MCGKRLVWQPGKDGLDVRALRNENLDVWMIVKNAFIGCFQCLAIRGVKNDRLAEREGRANLNVGSEAAGQKYD